MNSFYNEYCSNYSCNNDYIDILIDYHIKHNRFFLLVSYVYNDYLYFKVVNQILQINSNDLPYWNHWCYQIWCWLMQSWNHWSRTSSGIPERISKEAKPKGKLMLNGIFGPSLRQKLSFHAFLKWNLAFFIALGVFERLFFFFFPANSHFLNNIFVACRQVAII